MTVKKQKNGQWIARVSYKDRTGAYKQKSKYTFKTKKEALLWEQDTHLKVEQGVDYSNLSFYDYFMKWFDTYKANKVSKPTTVNYIATANKIKEFFHDQKVMEINNIDYQQFLNKYGKNLAKSTMQKTNKHIRSCVSDAIHNGHLQRDFTYRAEVIGKPGKEERSKYLNEMDAKRLIATLQANMQEDYLTSYMILLGITTGMRFGEIAGLTYESMDYKENTIYINKTWSSHENIFKSTKNKVNRTIKVDASIMDDLRLLKQNYFARGLINPNKFVFCTAIGKPPSNTASNKALSHACKRANVQTITMHSLRHTHASILLFNGMDISSIARRLGHQSTTTTADHYAHIISEHQNKSDQLADQVVQGLISKIAK